MKYIFLIGGYDLEMLEIKKILLEKGIDFLDKKLSWGAKWTDYSEYFELTKYKDKTFVGIELGDKEYMPDDAIDIEHHNFDSDKPSSIEQIASLLNIKLNRWQNLVAANDKAYIQGLESLCATKEEIKKIRTADKKAQGVTPEYEEKAKKAVEKSLKWHNNIAVIKTDIDKFSPITDLMYGKSDKLIIYNDATLNYYGFLPDNLLEAFEEEIKKDKAYYGGKKSNGFFGLAKSHWNKASIVEQKEEIIKLIATDMYSYHIFMFSFRWKTLGDNNQSLKQKFNLAGFQEKLFSESKDWERSKNPDKQGSFELQNASNYNEYNYFFDFVREVLYDRGENLQTSVANTNELVRHYNYIPADISNSKHSTLFYNIKVEGEIFSLEIDSILLNMYSTGVGVLSFHLRNKKHPDKEDILKINKLGRRIFPPFLSLDDTSVLTGLETTRNKKWLEHVTNNEIPEAIWLSKLNKIDLNIYEDFSDYLYKDNFKHGPFQLPKFIAGLFPEKFFFTHEKEKNSNSKIYLRPALDDRMHVVSWYASDFLMNTYQETNTCQGAEKYGYATDDYWHNFIFMDTWRTFQNKLELPNYLDEHTYTRWIDSGILYGMSRFSFVMLTRSHAPKFLIRHLQTMYYKMVELVLIQRATLISFSDEVTHVSDLIHNDEEKSLEKIEDIYKHYILFVNKIYFREVTAQEQGIEIYDMMQRIMRIPEQVKDLDQEIAELNSFASMMQDKKEREESKKHTRLATIFLPLMTISGLLGISFLKEESDKQILSLLSGSSILIYGTFLFLVITLIFVYWDYLKKKKLHIPVIMLFFWLSFFISLYFIKIFQL